MKESYSEGVANHPGPEPCEGSRKAAEHVHGPAESETPSTQRNSMRENRETPSPPVPTAGRKENAMSGKSFMNGGGESYRGVVPTKQPNKSETSPAEAVEGRPLAKENTQEPNSCRTPSRTSEPNGLARVAETAKKDKQTVAQSLDTEPGWKATTNPHGGAGGQNGEPLFQAAKTGCHHRLSTLPTPP